MQLWLTQIQIQINNCIFFSLFYFGIATTYIKTKRSLVFCIWFLVIVWCNEIKHQIYQQYHNCTYTLKQTFVWIQKKSKKSWNRNGTVLEDLKWLNLISKTLNMWAILINILTNIRNFAWTFCKICFPNQKNIPKRILVNKTEYWTFQIGCQKIRKDDISFTIHVW